MRLGYACINTALRKHGIFCSRTVRIKNATPERLSTLALQNTTDLVQILRWNAKNQIYLFRISSDLFPFKTHPILGYELDELKDWDQIRANLEEAGRIANKFHMRLTMHPSPYTNLSSLKPEVVKSAVADINMHGEILSFIGGQDPVINFHVGGSRNTTGLGRLAVALTGVTPQARSMISLENDDKPRGWQPEDLYEFCKSMRLGYTHDFHHAHCSGKPQSTSGVYINWCIDTYRRLGRKPKFHFSLTAKGKKIQAHSDYIDVLIPVHNLNVDVMLEAKAKERAIFFYRQMFGVESYVQDLGSTTNSGAEWVRQPILTATGTT